MCEIWSINICPRSNRHKPMWRHVSTQIAKAADGEKDLLEVCVSLRLVLALEGVEFLDEMNERRFGPTRAGLRGWVTNPYATLTPR